MKKFAFLFLTMLTFICSASTSTTIETDNHFVFEQSQAIDYQITEATTNVTLDVGDYIMVHQTHVIPFINLNETPFDFHYLNKQPNENINKKIKLSNVGYINLLKIYKQPIVT